MNYQIKVKNFEGPLELLLNLIESRELSINEISLARVTEEYFNFLTKKEELKLPHHTEIASFLVIAATLLVIKSRSLLPGFSISKEEEADIKELEERLLAYKIIKAMAGSLDNIAKKRLPTYTRTPYAEVKPSFLPPINGLDLKKMSALLISIIEAIPKKDELPQKTVKKIISIEDKIKELQTRIESGIVKSFNDFVGEKKEKIEVIISFLAMLELVKIGAIAVKQGNVFGNIEINHGTSKSN